jgi:hypothetical protein
MNLAHNSETINNNYLFLDFEANKAGEMYMAGFSTKGRTFQVVLNEKLQAAATHQGIDATSPENFVSEILEYIENNNLIIAAYSEAELNYCRDILGNKHSGYQFSYLNLAKAAKTWINEFHKDSFISQGDYLPTLHKKNRIRRRQLNNSLASRMRLTPFPPHCGYAPGKTTTRFNHVIAGLNCRKEFTNLTPTQKGKWTKALKHNRFDVEALPVLLSHILKDSTVIIDTCTTEVTH